MQVPLVSVLLLLAGCSPHRVPARDGQLSAAHARQTHPAAVVPVAAGCPQIIQPSAVPLKEWLSPWCLFEPGHAERITTPEDFTVSITREWPDGWDLFVLTPSDDATLAHVVSLNADGEGCGIEKEYGPLWASGNRPASATPASLTVSLILAINSGCLEHADRIAGASPDRLVTWWYSEPGEESSIESRFGGTDPTRLQKSGPIPESDLLDVTCAAQRDGRTDCRIGEAGSFTTFTWGSDAELLEVRTRDGG